MSSDSPGHDPDNPGDESAPAQNNEDTETPPSQGDNPVVDDRDNPAGSEVSSNGIDPIQEPDRLALEELQAPHDIPQFMGDELHDIDEILIDALDDLDNMLDSIPEDTDYGDFPEADNNADSSPREDAMNSSLEEEIESSKHSGDKEAGKTGNASLKRGDTPSNKEGGKAARATKPTSENSSSPTTKGKRGRYKCELCKKPKLVKALNGRLVPHLCKHLIERVIRRWKSKYKDKIPAEQLDALAEDRYGQRDATTVTEYQRMIQADAIANSHGEATGSATLPMHSDRQATNDNRKELSKPTSYMKKRKQPKRKEGGYSCGYCGAHPKVGHDCPICKKCKASKDGPNCLCERKSPARPSQNTVNRGKKRARQGGDPKPKASKRRAEENVDDRKPAAQQLVKESPQDHPKASYGDEETCDDRKPPAKARVNEAKDTSAKEESPELRTTNAGSQDNATMTAEPTEETALPDSTQGSTDIIQQETVASPIANEGAEQGREQLDSGIHQSPTSQNGTPKDNDTDEDFEEV